MNEPTKPANITLSGLQDLIRHMYFEKDRARGIEGTWMWFVEEVGELSSALRAGSHEERLLEFADVLAWLATLANIAEVDLSEAIARKYGSGCPGCGELLCKCPDAEKP
jgi:NTP pyrophosphatase (non-canonical NTP hydrolase)